MKVLDPPAERSSRFDPGPLDSTPSATSVNGHPRDTDELPQLEDRFRIMADCAPVMLWMAGRDKLCFFFNKPWLDFTGRTMEQEMGNGWAEGVHPDDFQECLDQYVAAFDARRDFRMEYRLKRRDGEYRWILDTGTRWFHDDGSFAGYIGSCIDITELREMREELERRVKERTRELAEANTELARSNADLEQFAYVASHDLQEPLRMVASYMELLDQSYKGRLDEKANKYIHYAVDGAGRMRALIDDLLAYSRVGRKDIALEPVDCSAVVDRAMANLQKAIQDSGADVTRDSLPTVDGNASQLTQLFQNLIGNAIKFCGEQPPRVHVGVEETSDEWTFAVRDSGIGIDPKHSDRIFLIFQRLHTRNKYPGTGIGLAVCRKVVERHGGRIWVESQPGNGSVFRFTLPKKGPQPSS